MVSSDSRKSGFISSIRKFIHYVEDGVVVVLLTSMIGLAVGQILARNIWDSGIEWSDPLLKTMVLWLGLIGAMIATRNNSHISINVLSNFLSATNKKFSDIITNLFSATISLIVAYHSYRFVMMEYEDGITATLDIPVWIFEAIIPFGFAVMGLRFLIYALIIAIKPIPPKNKIQLPG